MKVRELIHKAVELGFRMEPTERGLYAHNVEVLPEDLRLELRQRAREVAAELRRIEGEATERMVGIVSRRGRIEVGKLLTAIVVECRGLPRHRAEVLLFAALRDGRLDRRGADIVPPRATAGQGAAR